MSSRVAAHPSSSMRPASSKSACGQPALRVVRDGDGHLVPGDLEVGVVAHLLRRPDHRVGELHRADEVAALERLRDRVARALPAREPSSRGVDLLVGEQCHGAQLTPASARIIGACASPASSPRQPRRSTRSASARTWSRSPTSATFRPRRPGSRTSRGASSQAGSTPPRSTPGCARSPAGARRSTSSTRRRSPSSSPTLSSPRRCARSAPSPTTTSARLPRGCRPRRECISLDPSTWTRCWTTWCASPAPPGRPSGARRSAPSSTPASTPCGRRWPARRARALPHSSGSTRRFRAATGCRR